MKSFIKMFFDSMAIMSIKNFFEDDCHNIISQKGLDIINNKNITWKRN